MILNGRESRTGWRRVLTALDEAPGSRWSSVRYHGVRALLLLTAAVAVFLFFPTPRIPDTAVLELGVIAPSDVIAEFSFDIPKSSEEILREQVEAASGVPPVYDRLPAVRDSVLHGISTFFAAFDSMTLNPDMAARTATVQRFLESNRIFVPSPAIAALLDPNDRRLLATSLQSAVTAAYERGIAPTSLGEHVSTVRVREPDGTERIVPRDSLVTADRFYNLASQSLPPGSTHLAEVQRLILIRFFQPSLAFNQQETQGAQTRARAAVDSVRTTVLQGERIVAAHERVGEEEEARLAAYQAELTARGLGGEGLSGGLLSALGAILYNALVLGILGGLIFFFRRPLYADLRGLLLMTLLIVTVAGAGALIARYALPVELIPVTLATLVVAVLWEGRLALALALVLALLLGGQTPFLGVTAPFTIALVGAAAAFAVRMVERRSRTWLYISIISVAFIAAAITMGLMRSRPLEEIALSAGWGVANAVIASLLAIGFLPLLESFTGITTDQTLLELSDLNRKLLKRLSLEAPGTYAHTVNVANLAEAACHSIGANGLLARVGAYYHDIGKLAKPQYFIENQPRGRNPHDTLKPAVSSAIIRSHVEDGIKLAAEDHVPDVILRFIPEHHGTQKIGFFYDRAKEQDPTAKLNPSDFVYPGPKPQSQEAAILMLADAVESAARALADPTPVRIGELVDRLVSQKISDGQLDESPLTLKEIDQIKDSLTSVLTGMYHHRIDYPAHVPAPELAVETETVPPERR